MEFIYSKWQLEAFNFITFKNQHYPHDPGAERTPSKEKMHWVFCKTFNIALINLLTILLCCVLCELTMSDYWLYEPIVRI